MSIVIEHLTYVYQKETPLAIPALQEVSLCIEKGSFNGIIGPTGSGKSTLAQIICGLLKPTTGQISIDGNETTVKKRRDRRTVGRKAGLVFQYPENQLFAETVYQDIAFGPRNLGLDENEILSRVKEAMAVVNLDLELWKRSPFSLSEGQKRKVAIAGVLAMKPEILILDEPTAGLDPAGRGEILEAVMSMHEKNGLTTVLISHNMEDIARFTSMVFVFDGGRLVLEGPPREVFKQVPLLLSLGLDVPVMTALMHRLKQQGIPVHEDVLTIEEARQEILRWWKGSNRAQ
ncbi:MAG: energy-coupling factor transporter ATPase [Bacillota bacterium]